MKKLIFVDSDGTLKNAKGLISEKTKLILEQMKDKGIEVIITTGRPRYHALRIKNESNASRYVISSNGSEIFDDELKQVVFAWYLLAKDVIKVDKIARKYNARCIFTVDDKEYVTDAIKNNNQLSLTGTLTTFLDTHQVKQIFVRSDDEKTVRKAYQKIKKMKNIRIINESSYFQTNVVEEKGIWFSIISNEANKGRAIKTLAKYLNVALDKTYGFGNDYNDIEMFETVNHSIVVNNANDDLKEKAKIIAKSNDEDGVALFLEELFLKDSKGER